ncbi:hypothetical protein [Polyangium mundeleinium]|uniref:Ammonium transporter AmtB-like domain-containing protein n=1 Tax=Polyangium mundeleinium TaxID=2995306 RepID=A0ABT5EQB5_9BACT|nr:hypothetical protein [Polyangium mundeleinium]MDC0744020.1 hypothetical protein [Polyangium mundeleinium]
MRHLALAKILVVLSMRAAYPLAAPLLLGIFLVATVLFGPNGMSPPEALAVMRASPTLMTVLWTGWLLLGLPAARAALVPPSGTYLRWLPAPRLVFHLAGGVCALVVEAPWMLLFGRGEGLLSASTAGLAALAGHALAATRPWGAQEALAAAGVGFAVFGNVPPLAFGAALVAACLAVPAAFRRAPEASAGAARGFWGRSPLGALASTFLLGVLRGEPAVLGRALALAALAGLVLPLAARGHDLDTDTSIGALALGLAAVALSPGLSGAAAAVVRAERAASWLCDATGTAPRTRALAAALAGGLLGATSGLVLGTVGALGLHAPLALATRLVVLSVASGLATGAILVGGAREAEASPRRGDRGMIEALVWAAFGAAAASLAGELSLGMVVGVGIMRVGAATRRAEVLRRLRGAA